MMDREEQGRKGGQVKRLALLKDGLESWFGQTIHRHGDVQGQRDSSSELDHVKDRGVP